MTDEHFLRRARDLAEPWRGRTSPNPTVGCVIVQAGQVVGEGWHTGPGQPHAERMALAAAGDRACGATLYCTLEPCCHHGRTPPCTDAIIAAGVARVVYAVDDPDPAVAGGGRDRLLAAGVAVTSGVLAAAGEAQLESYRHHRRTGRPFVIAKWAMTLDGKLASAAGDARWVSGPAARTWVHRLRDRADAVLVGAGTVIADDPALTCRSAAADLGREPRSPVRVVADSQGRTPPTARVFTDRAAPTWWVTGPGVDQPRDGCEQIVVPCQAGRLDLAAMLAELGRRGVVELLSEAGGTLTGALLRAGLVDQVAAVVAPKLVGGRGPTPWDGPGQEPMAAALWLDQTRWLNAGDDMIVIGYPRPASDG